MTRSDYLAKFAPQNRSAPAAEWDRNHYKALAKLPPTDEVIAYGMERILETAKEMDAPMYGIDIRAMAIKRLADHHEIYGDLAHLNISQAIWVSWDLEIYNGNYKNYRKTTATTQNKSV